LGQEANRFALHLLANPTLCVENRRWAGAERTVIQEGDIGVERPVA
jgi:hypothetical protein